MEMDVDESLDIAPAPGPESVDSVFGFKNADSVAKLNIKSEGTAEQNDHFLAALTKTIVKEDLQKKIDKLKPVVYTTRLDDMLVLRKEIGYTLPQNIIKTIEIESKPKSTGITNNIMYPYLKKGADSFMEVVNKIESINKLFVFYNQTSDVIYKKGNNKGNSKNLNECKPCSVVLTKIDTVFNNIKPNEIIENEDECPLSELKKGNESEINASIIEDLRTFKFLYKNDKDFYVVFTNFYAKNTEFYLISKHVSNNFTAPRILTNEDLRLLKSSTLLIKRVNCCFYRRLYRVKLLATIVPLNLINIMTLPHSCNPKHCNCCCGINVNGSLCRKRLSRPNNLSLYLNEKREFESCLNNKDKRSPRATKQLKNSSTSSTNLIERALNFKFCYTNKAIISTQTKNNEQLHEHKVIVRNACCTKTKEVEYCDSSENTLTYLKTKSIKNADTAFKAFSKTSKPSNTFDVCCWVHREKLSKIWPNKISQILTNVHKCPIGSCTCCCKPQDKNITIKEGSPLLHMNLPNQAKLTPNLSLSAGLNKLQNETSIPKSIKHVKKIDHNANVNVSTKSKRNQIIEETVSTRSTSTQNDKILKTLLLSKKNVPDNLMHKINKKQLDMVTVDSVANRISKVKKTTSNVKKSTSKVTPKSKNKPIPGKSKTRLVNKCNSTVGKSSTLMDTKLIPTPKLSLSPPVTMLPKAYCCETNMSQVPVTSQCQNNRDNPSQNTVTPTNLEVDTIIASVLNRFSNVRLTIGKNGKVAAELNTPVNTLSTAELKVLASILSHAQTQVDALKGKSVVQIAESDGIIPTPNEAGTQSCPLVFQSNVPIQTQETFVPICNINALDTRNLINTAANYMPPRISISNGTQDINNPINLSDINNGNGTHIIDDPIRPINLEDIDNDNENETQNIDDPLYPINLNNIDDDNENVLNYLKVIDVRSLRQEACTTETPYQILLNFFSRLSSDNNKSLISSFEKHMNAVGLNRRYHLESYNLNNENIKGLQIKMVHEQQASVMPKNKPKGCGKRTFDERSTDESWLSKKNKNTEATYEYNPEIMAPTFMIAKPSANNPKPSVTTIIPDDDSLFTGSSNLTSNNVSILQKDNMATTAFPKITAVPQVILRNTNTPVTKTNGACATSKVDEVIVPDDVNESGTFPPLFKQIPLNNQIAVSVETPEYEHSQKLFVKLEKINEDDEDYFTYEDNEYVTESVEDEDEDYDTKDFTIEDNDNILGL